MQRTGLTFEEVSIGDAIPPLIKPITLVGMVMYAAATWDFIPLHFDSAYAQKRGLPQPCVDGQMLGAFLAQQLVDWMGPRGRLRTLAFRLREFVYPGDTLLCQGRVVDKHLQDGECVVACELWIENQDGVKVLSPARASVVLPSHA